MKKNLGRQVQFELGNNNNNQISNNNNHDNNDNLDNNSNKNNNCNPEYILIGLDNDYHRCYINCILQFLYHFCYDYLTENSDTNSDNLNLLNSLFVIMKEREIKMNSGLGKKTKSQYYINLKDRVGGLPIESDLSKVCDNIFKYSNQQQDVVEHMFKYIINSEDEKLNKSIDCKLKINEHYNFNEDLNYFNKSKDKFKPFDEELIIIKKSKKQ